MRRGRAKLPRGYYLEKTAKHGGFEIGNSESMPVISMPGLVGQTELPGFEEFKGELTENQKLIIENFRQIAEEKGKDVAIPGWKRNGDALYVSPSGFLYWKKASGMKMLLIGLGIVGAALAAKSAGLLGD